MPDRKHKPSLSKDGEAPSHNPFKKFRPQPRQPESIQLESRLARVHTADETRLSVVQARHREMAEGLAGLAHAQSFPADMSGIDPVSRMDSTGKPEPEPSRRSSEQINVTNRQPTDESLNGGPRKRRTFIEKLDTEASMDEEPCFEPKFNVAGQLRATILSSWINVLLACVPAGFAVNYTQGKSVATFVVNFFAIIPLSILAEFALQEIKLRGGTIAGFLYITLYNFVQFVSGIFLLKDHQALVLQTSLIGGILSNLLLMLGVSFILGGYNRMSQKYNKTVAHTCANLLSLSFTSLLIPTAAHLLNQTNSVGLSKQSRGASVVLLCVYFAYLFFQYKSHADIWNRRSARTEKRGYEVVEGAVNKSIAQVGLMLGTLVSNIPGKPDQLAFEYDDIEEPQLHIYVALGILATSTTLIAFCTQFAVDSIENLSQRANISKAFIGLILLPILNNDLAPITHALADEMDRTIDVTVGKCLQTALFVTPLMVLLAWPMKIDNMTLSFDGFEIVSLFTSVLLLNYLIMEGESTWIQGVLLVADWALIAIAAFFAE